MNQSFTLRVPVNSLLKSVDFPTLGRPTMATGMGDIPGGASTRKWLNDAGILNDR